MGCGVPFSPLRRNYVFLRLEHLDHHSVADGVTLEYGCAVLYGDSRVEFVMGLSALTLVTFTLPVIVSTGRTGALKLQFTCRNTLPGPGSCSATTALSIALVIPP